MYRFYTFSVISWCLSVCFFFIIFVTKEEQEETKIKRIIVYFLGMILVSMGIVLCVKCELGISPVSSLPFVGSLILPLSFGNCTMLFHLVNIAIQYIGEKKIKNIRVLMQIPVAVLFGWMIDLIKQLMSFSVSNLVVQIILLVFSIFFTAFGMACMLEMHLVQNPPDGTVALLSTKSGIEIGRVKIIYDVSATVLALLCSFLVLKRIEGFGIATIASAIFVGRTLTGIRRKMNINI